MWIILVLMIENGTHKIVSDQIIYPNEQFCKVSKKVLDSRLGSSAPAEPGIAFYSRCVEITENDRGTIGKPS